jgi:hypothetical protein
MHLHLSDGKRLSLQQETRPYDSGFSLGCCNSAISNLMERDPNCKYAAEKATVLVSLIQLVMPHGDRADLGGIVRWMSQCKGRFEFVEPAGSS